MTIYAEATNIEHLAVRCGLLHTKLGALMSGGYPYIRVTGKKPLLVTAVTYTTLPCCCVYEPNASSYFKFIKQ